MSNRLFVSNVRAADGTTVDLDIADGIIQAIGPGLTRVATCVHEEGHGALILPGFVEGHTHLDKTHWDMKWYRNAVPSRLTARIENERGWRAQSQHDAAAQSLALARAFLEAGTTRLRTHVDIDTDAGLKHLHGVMKTRDALEDMQEIQIVAFPQSGMLCRPGTRALLDEALKQGADVLGALDPALIDQDPVASLDTTFALADHHQKPIDIHLHEPGEIGAFTFRLLLDRVEAHGMQGRVVVSHAFCLGMLAERERDALLARIAKLEVGILTTAPASVAVPPWQPCREAGVTLFAGNDGIRDTWSPYGKPDMLERAMQVGMRYDLRRDEDLEHVFDCVSTQGAKACGFAHYGLVKGARADLVLVDAETTAHAIAARPVRRVVISKGRIVARDGKLIQREC